MDTVFELLEKAVLLIGQCNNTIAYEKRKMCYWVSQGLPHHKWFHGLKKRQHSYKNTIKYSLENISETT